MCVCRVGTPPLRRVNTCIIGAHIQLQCWGTDTANKKIGGVGEPLPHACLQGWECEWLARPFFTMRVATSLSLSLARARGGYGTLPETPLNATAAAGIDGLSRLSHSRCGGRRAGPHRHDSHGPTYKIAHLRCCLSNRQIGHNCGVLIPVSAISGMPHLLPLDELLRLREPQKWILRPIWGLGGHI